jgi:hypothetical protein
VPVTTGGDGGTNPTVLAAAIRGPGAVIARTFLIFGDIEGKLDVLNVECTRCTRYSAAERGSSHYPVCRKPAITLSRKDWHSSANRAVL